MVSAVADRRSAPRATSRTSAPARAKEAAMAAPMFLLAPVTSATWPSRRSASGPIPSSAMRHRARGDVEVGPGDGRGRVGAEEADPGPDVARRGEAAQRRGGEEPLACAGALRAQDAVEALAVDRAGRDEVDAD